MEEVIEDIECLDPTKTKTRDRHLVEPGRLPRPVDQPELAELLPANGTVEFEGE